MDYNLAFGRKKSVKKNKSSTSNKKLPKKLLNSLSLKNLKVIAKKYKVSCYKKGKKECVKKSTLLNRLKKSRSINKILKSASKMKKSGKKSSVPKSRKRPSRYGDLNPMARNNPPFSTPLELSLGQTYQYQRDHYRSIPSTVISQNFQGTGAGSSKTRMQLPPKNFKYTRGSLGRSSLPPYENINDPSHINYKARFGQYFR